MCWQKAQFEWWGMHPLLWDLLEPPVRAAWVSFHTLVSQLKDTPCNTTVDAISGFASCHVCRASANWCCRCHEIRSSLPTLWQPPSCYLIYVCNAINTFLFISTVSTSSRFAGSFMFLKYFGKSKGQSGVISGFVKKKKHPARQILFIYLYF